MTEWRTILLMGVILAFLAGAYFVQVFTAPSGLKPEAPKQIAEGEWAVEDVDKVRIHHRHGPDEVDDLVLARRNEAWVMAARGNAKAKASEVREAVLALRELKGEARHQTEDVLEEMGLSDEAAIHVELFAGDRPLVHLLVGKTMAGRGSLVRRAGDTKVMLADRDIRRLLGVDAHGHPDPKKWLDLQIQSLPLAEIRVLRLDGPEKLFEIRREGDGWILQTPAGMEVREGALARIVGAFAEMRAEDVPDPAETGKTGLDRPSFRATAEMADGRRVSVIFGYQVPQMEGQRYARIDEEGAQLYAVAQWTVRDVFPALSTLANLRGLEVDPNRVVRVRMRDGVKEVVLERGGTGVWDMTEPRLGFPVRSEGVKEIVEAAARAKPSDLASGVTEEEAELAGDGPSIVLEDDAGATYRIRVGRVSRSNETNRYVGFEGRERVFTLSNTEVRRFLTGVSAFVDLSPLFVGPEQVAWAEIESEGRTLRIERGEAWMVTAAGLALEAKAQGVDRFLQVVTEFRPQDMATRIEGKRVERSLRYGLADGRELRIRMGPLEETTEHFFARIGEEAAIYLISGFDYERARFRLSDLAEPVWPAASRRGAITEIRITAADGRSAAIEASELSLRVMDFLSDEKPEGAASLILEAVSGETERTTIRIYGEVPGNPGVRAADVEGAAGTIFFDEAGIERLVRLISK